MLSADPPNVAGALETVRRTIRDGHRACEVITRLRALFSNIHSKAELVDVDEATREVIALSLGEVQRSGVMLRTVIADDIPNVVGDRVQLQQVLLNLLSNALEAVSEVADRARRVMIMATRDGNNYVRVSVQDTGDGFDPDCEHKLFEAFYSTKTDGMGIGLSISRTIIESHGGRLWASLNDGPGSTFSFSIPCDPSGAAKKYDCTNTAVPAEFKI